LVRETLDTWREEYFRRYPKKRRVPGMALWKAFRFEVHVPVVDPRLPLPWTKVPQGYG
jgi:hypothetical protein